MKEYVATTANGFKVYRIVNDVHMLAHKDADENKQLLAEAVEKVVYTNPFWMETLDMGRIIGKDGCVEVTEEDDTCWACRPGRKLPSHLVFNKQPVETPYFTVGMCTDNDGLVTIFTAFAGKKAPKEPLDPTLKEEERAESEAFWATHALCQQQ